MSEQSELTPTKNNKVINIVIIIAHSIRQGSIAMPHHRDRVWVDIDIDENVIYYKVINV